MDVLAEIDLWAQRRAALAAGEAWQESRAGHLDGKSLDGAGLEAAIAAGRVRRCGQCSSPRQAVFHE